MPFRIPLRKKRAVNFRKMATEEPTSSTNNHRIEELSDEEEVMPVAEAELAHDKYLKMMLEGPYPKQFVAADATRPWMLYWALAAMSMLEVDLSEYREQ
jgi:hypothetical protein